MSGPAKVRLRRVDYRTDRDGRDVYELHFVQGRDAATATVTATVQNGIDAECEVLPVDSPLDEHGLEVAAETFVEEHADGFGLLGAF